MNTLLMVRVRENLEEIKTELEYTEVFPKGILSAGMEILSNPDMKTMAKRAIFQLGLYQNRMDFVLYDFYSELMMLDMRYKVDSGDMSDIESAMSEHELHQLRNTLNDLKGDSYDFSLRRDEYILGAMRLVYEKAKKGIDRAMHADSMFAICKLALSLGYRIILEDSDLTPFGAGIFCDLFKPNSAAETKITTIVGCGLSLKVILNDAQSYLPSSDPIINRLEEAFPEANSISFKVCSKVLRNE